MLWKGWDRTDNTRFSIIFADDITADDIVTDDIVAYDIVADDIVADDVIMERGHWVSRLADCCCCCSSRSYVFSWGAEPITQSAECLCLCCVYLCLCLYSLLKPVLCLLLGSRANHPICKVFVFLFYVFVFAFVFVFVA